MTNLERRGEWEGRGVGDERRERGILEIIEIYILNSVKFYFLIRNV
jgi:hypothetical protein